MPEELRHRRQQWVQHLPLLLQKALRGRTRCWRRCRHRPAGRCPCARSRCVGWRCARRTAAFSKEIYTGKWCRNFSVKPPARFWQQLTGSAPPRTAVGNRWQQTDRTPWPAGSPTLPRSWNAGRTSGSGRRRRKSPRRWTRTEPASWAQSWSTASGQQ